MSSLNIDNFKKGNNIGKENFDSENSNVFGKDFLSKKSEKDIKHIFKSWNLDDDDDD
jgi:hypothetical protein